MYYCLKFYAIKYDVYVNGCTLTSPMDNSPFVFVIFFC